MANQPTTCTRAVYLMDDKVGIDHALAGKVIKELLAWDQIGREPIRLFIFSDGGYVDSANHIRDTILCRLGSPVITIGIGLVQSCAASIFASGAIRLMLPKTELMFHKIFCSVKEEKDDWTEQDFADSAKEYAGYTQAYLCDCTQRLPTHRNPCRLTPRQLLKRINHPRAEEKKEYTIRPQTALRLGFIDGIIKNSDGIKPYEQLLIEKQKKKG